MTTTTTTTTVSLYSREQHAGDQTCSEIATPRTVAEVAAILGSAPSPGCGCCTPALRGSGGFRAGTAPGTPGEEEGASRLLAAELGVIQLRDEGLQAYLVW